MGRLVQQEAQLGIGEGVVERPVDAGVHELLAHAFRRPRAHRDEAQHLVDARLAERLQRAREIGHSRLARDERGADRRPLAPQQSLRLGEVRRDAPAVVDEQQPGRQVVEPPFQGKQQHSLSLGHRQAPRSSGGKFPKSLRLSRRSA